MPSHPLSFTIPFLYFLCSGAYLSLGLRLPEGSWPCYKSERTTRGCGLWGTTLGSPLVLRTRAETWVFPHNPRPLVFFLLHNPQVLSSYLSLVAWPAPFGQSQASKGAFSEHLCVGETKTANRVLQEKEDTFRGLRLSEGSRPCYNVTCRNSHFSSLCSLSCLNHKGVT